MARINLLPWRQQERKDKLHAFLRLMGWSLLLVIVAVGSVYYLYSQRIDRQNSRNRYLQEQINKVDRQIKEINDLHAKKERLLARMDIIQKLQRNRPEVVRMFDEMVRVMPDGVYLTSFKQQNTQLTMTGVAQSNARVSALMRNIDQSEWLTNPRLVVIQAGKSGESRQFTLLAQQKLKQEKTGKKKVSNNRARKK